MYTGANLSKSGAESVEGTRPARGRDCRLPATGTLLLLNFAGPVLRSPILRTETDTYEKYNKLPVILYNDILNSLSLTNVVTR